MVNENVILVNDKPYRLRFDLRAVLALKSQYGISITDLPKLMSSTDATDQLDIVAKLLFAMTRCMGSNAPTDDEILSFGVDELARFREEIAAAHTRGMVSGLGKASADAAAPGGAGVSGTSGKSSRKAAHTSGSRRKRS